MDIDRKKIIRDILQAITRSRILLLDGVHRSGKSTLLAQAVKELRSSVPPVHVIHIKEGHGIKNERDLAAATRGLGVGPSALCLDDADSIPGCVEALAAILSKSDTVAIVTGARTASLAETIEARFGQGAAGTVRIPPLGYSEWLSARKIRDSAGALHTYAQQGGLPDSLLFPGDDPRWREFLEMRADSLLLTRIIESLPLRNPAAIRPMLGLLATHMGEILSARQIREALEGGPGSLSPQAILDYLEACRASGVIVPVPVTDLTAERDLQAAQVWYFADNGLRTAFAGRENAGESDRALRNLLFLALTEAGWSVRQGRIDAAGDRKEEISFVCEAGGKRMYAQAVGNAATAGERVRKYRALLSVRDAWPKYLIDPMGPPDGQELTAEGVRHLTARGFLREPIKP